MRYDYKRTLEKESTIMDIIINASFYAFSIISIIIITWCLIVVMFTL